MWADAAYRAREARLGRGGTPLRPRLHHGFLSLPLQQAQRRVRGQARKPAAAHAARSSWPCARRWETISAWAPASTGTSSPWAATPSTDSRADGAAAAAKLGLDYICVSAGGKFEDAVPTGGRVARSLHRLLGHPHHAARLDAGKSQYLSGRRIKKHHQCRGLHHPGDRRGPHAHARALPKTSCRSGEVDLIGLGPSHPLRPLLAQEVPRGPGQRHAQVHVLQLLPGDGRRVLQWSPASSGRKKAIPQA